MMRTAATSWRTVHAIALLLGTLTSSFGAPTASLRMLEERVARLEQAAADRCASVFPTLHEGDTFAYAGCNRNTHRKSTVSVQSCQNGTLQMYNTSDTASSGLFDIRIAANVPTHDVWHFVCALVRDEPHHATCTLTFETPTRPEGPAWLSIRFGKVSASSPAGPCRASEASLLGTYFYDALTNDAGVYAFYAKSSSS